MKDAELDSLLWQELEGTLEPDGRRRLDRWAEGRPEADERRAQVRRMSRLFESATEAEPPPDLRELIRSGIESRKAGLAPRRAPAPRPGFLAWIRESFQASWRARYAYSMLGVLIGAFAVLILSQPAEERAALDDSNFYGTLSPAAGVPGLDLADGLLRLERGGDGSIVVRLQAAGSEPLNLAVGQPGGSLRLLAVEEAGRTRQQLRLSAERLTVEQAGSGKMAFHLEVAGDRPLEVSVLRGGVTLVERSVALEEIPGL